MNLEENLGIVIEQIETWATMARLPLTKDMQKLIDEYHLRERAKFVTDEDGKELLDKYIGLTGKIIEQLAITGEGAYEFSTLSPYNLDKAVNGIRQDRECVSCGMKLNKGSKCVTGTMREFRGKRVWICKTCLNEKVHKLDKYLEEFDCVDDDFWDDGRSSNGL